MGRMLGAFDDEMELDRPDLNKCPDCNCYFGGDCCPICGKECPENMRAGNRAAVKPKKRKKKSQRSGVVFVNWYYSWWFIILMMVLAPVVGIVLLLSSPHEKWKKILFCAIAVVYIALQYFGLGIGNIFRGLSDLFDSPVDKSLTREEYIEKCETVTPEQIHRSADYYEDEFVCVELRIIEKVTYLDDNYNEKDYVCYRCRGADGGTYVIIIRDCLIEEQQRFVSGDVVVVYGEGDGECTVYDSGWNYTTAPCINVAYAVLK